MPAAVVQRSIDISIANAGTLAFGSNVTAGNHIAILGIHNYLATPPTPTDTIGNTFTKHVNGVNNGVVDDYFYVWTALIGSSAANSIAFSMGAGLFRLAAAIELSGLDPADPFGGYDLSTNTANPIVAGSVTPTVNGSYIGAIFRNTSGDAASAIAPLIEQYDTAGRQYFDVVQTAAGIIVPSATAGGSPATAEGFTAYFNALAGGGGPSAAAMARYRKTHRSPRI